MRPYARILSPALLLTAAGVAGAQTPYRIRDINTTDDRTLGYAPESIVPGSPALWFIGTDPANGREVRRYDPSTGAVTMPVDLAPGPAGGPFQATIDGDTAYATWRAGLYRMDGGVPGATALLQFPYETNEMRTPVAAANGVFVGVSRFGMVQQLELWWSDGTAAGTIHLTGNYQSGPTRVGNGVFFVGGGAGFEPWTSDGTVAGTHLVKDVCPGPCDGVSDVESFVDVNGTGYFVANDGVVGRQLWRSDGTEAGTFRVSNVGAGGPTKLTAFGNRLLFTTASGDDLWITDGTLAGTVLLQSGLAVGSIVDSGGLAFFDAQTVVEGRELWRTDGTPAGTTMVEPCPGLCARFSAPAVLGRLPGIVLFQFAEEDLWRSDGTAAGTFLIHTFPSRIARFTRAGAYAYFAASTSFTGSELWRTDGTGPGTDLLTDLTDASSWQAKLASAGDRMFFTARTELGVEPWSTTGTAASTTGVDLEPGPGSSHPLHAAPLGNRLAIANGPFLATPTVWITDGTAGGSAPLSSVEGFDLRASRGLVFFGAGLGPDVEPWRTDGTPDGTFRLANVEPGAAASYPKGFVDFAGATYFFPIAHLPTGVWKTDGTAEGTLSVIPLTCTPAGVVAATMHLACSDGASGSDWWISDGTAAGTHLLKDGVIPMTGVDLDQAITAGGVDFVVAGDSAHGRELWRTDDTEAGTVLVKDIAPGLEGSTPFSLTPFGDLVLFFIRVGQGGVELWRSDGQDAGTFRLAEIQPSIDFPAEIAVAGGRAFFPAHTRATGVELWTTDGTVAGTMPLAEIAPGPRSSNPRGLHAVGNRVYFGADDGVTGSEPWALDLPAGAVSVADVSMHEGDSGTSQAAFTVRLDGAAGAPVIVGYATVAGTAQAGSDFTPRSGTLTFAPGETARPVDVAILGDIADEVNETFALQLTAVGNAVLARPRAEAVVLDDDAPRVSIAASAAHEGDSGPVPGPFTVTLATKDGGPTPTVKTVGFDTLPLTATANQDFTPTSGTITFPSGVASGASASGIASFIGDTTDESDESIAIRLRPTSDATVAGTGTLVILDDDGIDSAPPVELAHGAAVRASLAPLPGRTGGRDWYALAQAPYASYEIVVDEVSGDAVPLQVTRVSWHFALSQTSVPVGTGGARALRWQNATSAGVTDDHISVASTACGTACGPDDTYRIRFRETTLAGSRFNNLADQRTFVLLQNASDAAIDGSLILWSGAPPTTPAVQPFSVAPRGVAVIDTAPIASGAGSITVTHDGPYGSIVGKAVSLQIATGLSFDTPLAPRPR